MPYTIIMKYDKIRTVNEKDGVYYVCADVSKAMNLKHNFRQTSFRGDVLLKEVETKGGVQKLKCFNDKQLSIVVNNSKTLTTREKIDILRYFGLSVDVLVNNKESEFYSILRDSINEIDSSIEICRQYYIDKYIVDFCIIGYGILIEYDENYHVYNKPEDLKRETEILKQFRNLLDDIGFSVDVKLIRVKYDEEGKGLTRIIKHILTSDKIKAISEPKEKKEID